MIKICRLHLITDAAANKTILSAEFWDTMNIEVVQWNKYHGNHQYEREGESFWLLLI